jgi:competence protein ComEC
MTLLCFLLILFPARIDLDFQKQFIVWNIGQGQWITAVDFQHCYHFDVGGEYNNSNKISSFCSKKENLIFYSHWDWDHVGLTGRLKGAVKNLCIAARPIGDASEHKKKLLAKIPKCDHVTPQVKKLNFNYPRSKNANDLSQIFIYNKRFLIPGDSTEKMEKIWGPMVNSPIHWLSVAHHGSRTSTSEALLKRLPDLTQAFVSARHAVYGHPHKIVMDRMRHHGISVLKTEDWGNIHLYFH